MYKFLLLFLFPFQCIYAQVDSLQTANFLEKTLQSIEKGETEIEEDSLKLALAFYQEQGNLHKWMLCQRKIGAKLIGQKKYSQGVQYFENAINAGWRGTQNRKEIRELAYITWSTSFFYYKHLNIPHLALKYCDNYETLSRDSMKKPELFIAEFIYNHYGNIYSKLRNEAKSKYYFEEIKRITKENGKWEMYAKACRNLNALYKELNKYSLALEALQEARHYSDSLSIYKQTQLLSDLGLTYWQLEDYSNARIFTDQSKAFLLKNKNSLSKSKIADLQYNLYYNYGRINKKENNFQKAESDYLSGLKILKSENYGASNRQFAIMNMNLGQLYLDQLHLDKAIPYFQNTIQYLARHLSKYQNPFSIPEVELINEDLLSHVYHRLGNIEFEYHRSKNDTTRLNRALRYFELADYIDQLQLQEFDTEQSSLNAQFLNRELIEDRQNAQFELWRINPQDSLKEKLFAFGEQSKSGLLREQNKLSESVNTWNDADQKNYYLKMTRQENLLEEIYDLEQNPEQISSKHLGQLRAELLSTAEDLTTLKRKKLKDSGFKLNQSISVKQIQHILAPNQALIQFFLGEQNLFTYSISKESFDIYKTPITPAFLQDIEKLRISLIEYNEYTDSYGQAAFSLYQYLLKEPLADLPSTISRLVFANDQALNDIPFDVLLTKPFHSNTIADAEDYLINKYSISYANSASLFVQQSQTKPGRAKLPFAGYAPRYQMKNLAVKDTLQKKQLASLVRSGYYDLPGAQDEVLQIAEQMGGEAFVDQVASEFHFKQNAHYYSIIHLGMHAILNENNSNFSELIFTRNAAVAQGEDNFLKPIEINNLPLNADLVVLSACETGLGDHYPGEGVFSIARSFSYAGVPSTVMSLWRVHDVTTPEIMISFYKNLRNDLPKDQALQQAKLKYLARPQNPERLHPFYWAGLQLVGNAEPLQIPGTFNISQFLIMLFISILIFVAYYIWNKKSNPKI